MPSPAAVGGLKAWTGRGRVAHHVVRKHAAHRLANWDRTDANARVVAALCDIHLGTEAVHRPPGCEMELVGFTAKRATPAGRSNPRARHPPVRQEDGAPPSIRISSAASSPGWAEIKPSPISTPLTALMLIIAEANPDRACRRSAPTRRHTVGHDLHHRPGGGARFRTSSR